MALGDLNPSKQPVAAPADDVTLTSINEALAVLLGVHEKLHAQVDVLADKSMPFRRAADDGPMKASTIRGASPTSARVADILREAMALHAKLVLITETLDV